MSFQFSLHEIRASPLGWRAGLRTSFQFSLHEIPGDRWALYPRACICTSFNSLFMRFRGCYARRYPLAFRQIFQFSLHEILGWNTSTCPACPYFFQFSLHEIPPRGPNCKTNQYSNLSILSSWDSLQIWLSKTDMLGDFQFSLHEIQKKEEIDERSVILLLFQFSLHEILV